MNAREDMLRLIAPIAGRVRLMLSRAIVNLVSDEPQAQELQIDLLADETHDAVERLQDYGFTSVPHAGAEALVGFVWGLRSHGVVIAVGDRRYRLRGLEAGEVAMHDDLGNVVKLGRNELTIEGVAKVRVIAPIAVIEADDVRLGGDGGAAVARVGDDVNLTTGKIISGSAKVTAA